MQRLKGCPHAIQLYHHQQVGDAFYLLLQLGSSSLADLLASPTPHHLLTRHLWHSMLRAVDACHAVGILHRDLKPANFVFVGPCDLRIIDFGIAKVMGRDGGGEKADGTSVLSEHLMGTINYMSPESLESRGGVECFRQNRKADVWALGCILYQMYYGKCPFTEVQGVLQKIRAITDKAWVIPFPEVGLHGRAVDPMGVEVMQRCLEREVTKRASIDELLNHRYIT